MFGSKTLKFFNGFLKMYDYAHVHVEFFFSAYPETSHFKSNHVSVKWLI